MSTTIPDPVQYAAWVVLEMLDLRKDARFHPEEEINDLAKSMQSKQLQNIIVNRNNDTASPECGRYEVIVGVGRVLAAKKNGWEKIRADVYEGLTEFQKLDMIFSENEDRRNASPLYQGQVLKAMMEAGDLTQEQLAEMRGKTQENISQYLSLLGLSPKIWQNINAFIKFGLRHFIQLLRLENGDDQWKFAEITREKDLSSSELGMLIDKQLGVKPGAKKVGRPKGDKTVGADGFAFVQKGSNLRIKANCDLAGDLDTFLAQLKAAILTWRESHTKMPATMTGERKPP